MPEFNIWAVLVAALASFVLGGLWYSPMLFGKAWQRETGLSDEKLAGGNMARNTTIIRSNYLWDESAGIYEHALKLWEGLEEELGYPILFSRRGVLNLAHSPQDVRDSVRRVYANRLNGIDAEWLGPEQVKEVCPIVDVSPEVRHPVLGATYQPRAGIAKLGVPESALPRMVDAAMKVQRLLAQNPRHVSAEDARDIYRRAF